MKPNLGSKALPLAMAAAVSAASGPNGATERVPEGRQKTERAIVFNLVVEGSPQEIYRLWTTREGVNRFFGVEAVIDGAPGGAYEIYFLPLDHPETLANSTHGAKLLWAEPGELLAFEWTCPPFAPELNTDPLPTWVEVTFSPLEGQPGKTHLHLEHHGFGRSGSWDRVYETFWKWWGDILFRLQRLQATPAA